MSESLIQIHYHLGTGGVTTVIRRYSEMFVKLTNGYSRSFVFCNEEESAGDTYTKVINVKECAYRKYTNEREFINSRGQIESCLEKCICEQQKNGRVIVIAHNLALGKNLALTSAFYNCARKDSLNAVTFFSVLHDFAEEGRIGELDAIRDVERFQNDIKKQMYCIDAPVKIVVPNKSTLHMMRECGFDVSIVSNPVNCEKVNLDKKTIESIRHSIVYNAHEQQLPFDNQKKIAYYPVRIIPRKNIYEAILISCIFLDSSLITGPSGKSEQDIIRYRTLNDFIRINKLPVMIDAITKCNLQNDYYEKVTETMMLATDYVISTSIAEGFGYALFESWVQQKMLVARNISGYCMPEGWNDNSMYSFLPVPVKWVDIERVVNCYENYFSKCFNKIINWSVQKAFIYNGSFIDFAVLPECIQRSTIEMVLNNSNKRKEWMTILEENFNGWPGLQELYNNANQSMYHHFNLIIAEYSDSMFKNAFSEVFLKRVTKWNHKVDHQKIEMHFQSPDYFRLLLGNQYCKICEK